MTFELSGTARINAEPDESVEVTLRFRIKGRQNGAKGWWKRYGNSVDIRSCRHIEEFYRKSKRSLGFLMLVRKRFLLTGRVWRTGSIDGSQQLRVASQK